jgi:hypothetical protein
MSLSKDGLKRNTDGDGDQDSSKRACTEALGCIQMVGKRILNQGGGRTCVAHSFALAMTQGLQNKYEIGCDPTLFVEKVKALCPCWEGHQTELMPKEWNEVHANDGACIENLDRTMRYNVRVEFRKIDSFDEAHREMERAQALHMYLPCTMITDDKGHPQHSVALKATLPGGTMQAQNSWGAEQIHMTVTRENFICAITFDPIITAAVKSGGMKQAVPPRSDAFRKRLARLDEQEAASAANEEKYKNLESKVKDQADMIKTLIHENSELLHSKEAVAANAEQYKTLQNKFKEQTDMIQTLIHTNGELLLSEEVAAANEENYKILENKVKEQTDMIQSLKRTNDQLLLSSREMGVHYKGKCGCGFECDEMCDGICCKCAEDDPDTNCEACNRRHAGPISGGDEDGRGEDLDEDDEDEEDGDEMESDDESEEWKEESDDEGEV